MWGVKVKKDAVNSLLMVACYLLASSRQQGPVVYLMELTANGTNSLQQMELVKQTANVAKQYFSWVQFWGILNDYTFN